MLERQRFTVADDPALLDIFQQVFDAFDDILPPAAGDAEPQPRRAVLQQGQFRFQFHKAGALRQGVVLQLSQCPFLIGAQRCTGCVVGLRLVAPPFFAEQHFKARNIAVFPGSFRLLCGLFGQVGHPAHHAGDLRRLSLCAPLYLHLFLFFQVIQQQRTDVLTKKPIAIIVIRTGTACTDETAILPQPRLRGIQMITAASDFCAEMPYSIFLRLAVKGFDMLHVIFGPRKDRAAQQIVDVFHVHFGFPPLPVLYWLSIPHRWARCKAFAEKIRRLFCKGSGRKPYSFSR